MAESWDEWRLIYKGGKDFQNAFTYQRPREKDVDYKIRISISPIPTHAKAAINNVKNTLFSRIGLDAQRLNGPKSYQEAILGQNGGVDREHNSMNSFLNTKILPDLLSIGKIGVYIDAARTQPGPYLYTIRAEDIRNWQMSPDNPGEFIKLLYRNNEFTTDEFYGLPDETFETFILLQKVENGIMRITFDTDGEILNEIILDLPKIPFVLFELTESLLTDVSSYQISLLNLASSDLTYAYLSNIPLYIEQVSNDDIWNFAESETDDEKVVRPRDPVLEGHGISRADIDDATRRDTIGATRGRTYPQGLDPPAFINPSPDPLKISMEKEQELKDDIRALINLSLSNIKPRAASAESKVADDRSLESGLSAIGLELESGENAILEIWAIYEEEPLKGKVTYPTNYELKDDKTRRENASDILTLKEKIPSQTARIELTITAARELFGSTLPQKQMEKLISELKSVGGCPSGAKEIETDLELGLVTAATASVLRGYEEGEAKKAQLEKAKRQAAAQEAQRGEEDFVIKRGEGELNDEDV